MFPFGTRASPPPRLPRPVPPFPGETTASYIYRLAVANELHPADLRAHLAGRREHRPVTLDAMAAATGRSQRALAWALAELRPGVTPRADPVLPGHVRRTVCWRGSARHDAFPYATVWQPAEASICPSHRITPLIQALRGDIPMTGKLPTADSVTAVVIYPETVDLACVLAMPCWRNPATAAAGALPQFQREVSSYTGIRYEREDSRYDPLFRWFLKHSLPKADEPA